MNKKYICNNCGYYYKKKDNLFISSLKYIIVVFIGVMSIMGTMSFINFVWVVGFDNPDNLISIGGFYESINNIFGSQINRKEIKQLQPFAENISKNCSTDECKSEKIYNYLLNFKYKYKDATDTNPIHTWNAREGDCDQMSILLISMLKSIDINSVLSCTTTHCWTIIKLKNKEILADIVQKRWIDYGK